MKNNFDLRKFLIENKLTRNSSLLKEDSDEPYTDYRDNSDGTWDAPEAYVHNVWRDVSIQGKDAATRKKNKEELTSLIDKLGYKYEIWKGKTIYYFIDGRTRPKKEDAEQIDQVKANHEKQASADFAAKPKGEKIKPKKLKKLTVGGKTYEKGDFDPNDDGRIESIEKYPNGYFIRGGVYSDYGDGDGPKEEYGYAIDLKGNEMDDIDLEGRY